MEKISQSLQENLLVLFCYSKKDIPILINSFDPKLFESSIYREIAGIAITFFHQFNEPIGSHLKDELKHKINPKKKTIKNIEIAKLYKMVLSEINELKEGVNSEYIMSQLTEYIELQDMKNDILRVHKYLSKDEVSKEDIEKSKLILYTNKSKHLQKFDEGVSFGANSDIMSSLNLEEDLLCTGIKELDNAGACPSRKSLTLFSSLPGKGKSWFMIMVGKYNAFHRKKVLHISLEMYWKEVVRRYLQCYFGISESDEMLEIPRFNLDNFGKFHDFKMEKFKPNLWFEQKDIGKTLKRKLNKIKGVPKLIIKDFPSGSLTVKMLQVYLDSLINYSNFHPDLLIIDYADLMKVDAKNKRIDLGNLLIELRGLASTYNCALLTGAQFNRGAKLEKRHWYDERFFQEDFSKANTADKIISFNQTDSEFEKKLARLLVVKNRGRRGGQKVIITQSYDTGQFAVETLRLAKSKIIAGKYWNAVESE